MRNWIRKIHLFAGLVLLVFVLMYFVTGFLMIHERLIGESPSIESKTKAKVSLGSDLSALERSIELKRQLGITGKNQPPKQRADGSWEFEYNRPGISYEVVLTDKGDEAQITRSDLGLRGLIHGYHRTRGYGQQLFYNLWAVLYDAASASMILFAVTGVYLWYQHTRRHALGWICLGVGLALMLSTTVYFMFMP